MTNDSTQKHFYRYDLPVAAVDWEELAADYEIRTFPARVAEPGGQYQSKILRRETTEPASTSSPLTGYPRIPSSIGLRTYQRQAAIGWFKNKGRGTLKMATGSGKTITALAIAAELYQKIGLQALIVLCPYRHLVTQWARECEKFNLQPILAFENVRSWQSQLSLELYNLRIGNQSFLTVIATNSTFIGEGLQSQLKFLPEKTLMVGDEAHNLGSARLGDCLPRHIGLRLALSATPERYFDDDGTDALLAYFGDILQPEFTLADAIRQGALVSYYYYPILIELTQSESLAYAKLTQRIGWALSENENLAANDTLTSLLMQRSRLVGAATNKLEALRDLMRDRLHTYHTLFYCGDGYVDTVSAYRRQLEAVTSILGKELGYRVNTYTSDTSVAEREMMRQQFERGDLQGLVAIRCLDEGVDIPAIEHAVILASTGNPRQFIQRRGRILRPHPGKKYATLFDMIVVPPDLDRETWEVERSLLRKELKRYVEFADLADNAAEARNTLAILQEKYGLLDI